MDKEEIIRIARKIGTFETSILPYEDCCTVFTPRHPAHPAPTLEEIQAGRRPRWTSTPLVQKAAGTDRAYPGIPPGARADAATGGRSMSHTAELIAVGTELLLGNIANTDAQMISQGLSALGINVYLPHRRGGQPPAAAGRRWTSPKTGRTFSSPPAAWAPPATT